MLLEDRRAEGRHGNLLAELEVQAERPAGPAVVDRLTHAQFDLLRLVGGVLADGLETLEELDIGIREEFIEHGGKQLKVINCLNDDEQWIRGLEQLVKKEFETIAA